MTESEIEVTQDAQTITLTVPGGAANLTADEATEIAGRLLEAAMLANGGEPDEADTVRVPMQYLVAQAERLPADVAPTDGEDELHGASRAEVHCWIKDQTFRNGLHVAAGWVAEHGWVITEVLEQKPATRADFEDSDYLQYFEQAVTESEVFLYEIENAEGAEEG